MGGKVFEGTLAMDETRIEHRQKTNKCKYSKFENMGAGIVIAVWLIVAGIYGCIFLAFAGIWFWGRKKNITWLKWLGKIPAIGMAAIALCIIAFISWGIVRSKNPNWVFKQQFNVTPPVSVSKIQSAYYWFADTGDIYLRFQTSEEEFYKLVSTNLVMKTVEEMKSDAPGESGGNIPKSWDYSVESEWIYYLRVSPSNSGSGKRDFSNETEYFAYNPKTQIAYYHFIGID